MCVVTLNMVLKPYLKFYSSIKVVIQVQFGSWGSINEINTFLYGLWLNSIPYFIGFDESRFINHT